MQEYLKSSTYIDWTHPDVRTAAGELADGEFDDAVVTRRCFEFVRDEIRHCCDANDEVLTVKASEVLHAGTGFCYAKSHLLAALLRANNIPAALCYQRLKGERGHSLHGLNAVHLKEFGWYRIDPRGNKLEVDAQFMPPLERLAFRLGEDERDVPGYWSEPASSIVQVLTQYSSVSEAQEHLPSCVDA